MPPPTDSTRPRSSSETVHRVLAAAVFLPFFYYLVHDLGPIAFLCLAVTAGMLAVGEFYRLHLGQAPWLGWCWLGVAATGLLIGSAQWPTIITDRAVLLGTLAIALCLPLLSGKSLRDSLTDGMVLIMGVLYIGLTLSYLVLVRGLSDGAITKRVLFRETGDFEGVEMVGDRIYCLKSDGTIFEISQWENGKPQVVEPEVCDTCLPESGLE